MANERPESKVIRKNYSRIANAITTQGLTDWFATKLVEEDFIVGSAPVMGVTQYARVLQMLAAVQNKLSTTGSPVETFKQFIKILDYLPALVELTKDIKTEYGNSYGGTAFQSSTTTREGSNSAGDSSTARANATSEGSNGAGDSSTARANAPPADTGYVFEAEDLQKLMLLPVAADWWRVGLQLDIKPPTLNTIKASHPSDPQRCLVEAFDWWLQNGDDPTYKKLKAALKNTEHGDAVKKLSELYGRTSDASPHSDVETLPKPSVAASERNDACTNFRENRQSLLQSIIKSKGDVRRRPLRSKPVDDSPVEASEPIPPATPPATHSRISCGWIVVVIGVLLGCAVLGKQTFWPNGQPTITTVHDRVSSSAPASVRPTSTDTVTATSGQKPTVLSQAAIPETRCTVIDDYMKVIQDIENAISDWKLLGEELGIKPTVLDRINRDQHGERSKLRETVREWQRRVPEDEFCWEKLIDALKAMDEIRLAKNISKQYGITWKEAQE